MKMTKIALGVALAAGTVAAQAGSLLFPYVTTNGSSVTTIVSVINTGAVVGYNSAGAVVPGGDRLHWAYVNKNGANAARNSAQCAEVDFYLPHSANDIQTVDLGGQLSNPADKGVLFNDASVNNNWRGPLTPTALTYAMASVTPAPSRGYLQVIDANIAGVAAPLSGQAMVFDYGTGAAWGYRGVSEGTAALGEYASASAPGHAPAVAGSTANVNFFPLTETVTRFFIMPVPAAPAQLQPGIGAYGNTSATISAGVPGRVAFDRDENAVSGSTPVGVTCVGSVDLVELMAPGARTILQDGGWTQVQLGTGHLAYVYHLEFGGGLNYRNALGQTTNGTFNGKPANGTFNNAFRIL